MRIASWFGRYPWVFALLILLVALAMFGGTAHAVFGDTWAVGRDSSGLSYWRVTSTGVLTPGKTAAYDIGSGSLKPRDFFLSRNATVGGNVVVTGTVTSAGVSTTGQPTADATTDLGALDKEWRHAYLSGDIYGAGQDFKFPAAGGTFVTTAGTQSLTNKTLTSPVISGGTLNNCPVGGATPAAGAFTDLSSSNAATLAGVANTGKYVLHRTTSDTNYNALSTDEIIAIRNTDEARGIYLPDSTGLPPGQIYYFKDESGGANSHNITIYANGTDTIDGAATSVMSQNYGKQKIYTDGAGHWFTY